MLADLIARLEALDKAATPGPWHTVGKPWMDDDQCDTYAIAGSADPHGGTAVLQWCEVDEVAAEDDGDLEKARERLESVQRANLAVAVALRNELPRLLRLLRAGEKAKGSLERCDEYMDQRADADLAPGGEAMQPNREMVLMQEIRAALREWDEAGK